MKMRSLEVEFAPAKLRQAFGCFPSGVTAVCGLVDGRPEGIAASSYTSVSLDPALVLVCFARTSSTWPKLARLSRLGLSVLSDAHHDVARRLGSKSADRFENVGWRANENDAVFVEGAALWMECEPYSMVTAGDHDVVFLRVTALSPHSDVGALVFHRSELHAFGSS